MDDLTYLVRSYDPQFWTVVTIMAVVVLVTAVRWRERCEFWTWGKEDEP